MRYSLHKVEHENTTFHCVYEIVTEQLIKYFTNKKEAQRYMDFLNNGGAFNGFTPSFILKELKEVQETDINESFDKEFLDF